MNRASQAMGLVTRTATKFRAAIDTVRLRRRMRAQPQFRPDVPPHVDVLLNFPDGLTNLYQVRQWYGPLETLSRSVSVAILCYRPETAQAVAAETTLKVILTPSFTDLTEVTELLDPKVILYPNQNYANYRILGLDRAQHVFICHGESDKIYMASNWVKVFNYFFIAGQASHDRLEQHVRNYDVAARTIRIGRPQIDVPSHAPLERSPGRIAVLYAPTWEGGRATMRYGSVFTHGRRIIDALLADDRFQIIYRPHPRTGVHLPEVFEADREIRRRIASAAEEDPGAGHLIDTTPFGWQLDFADLMIADVSAVAYDWLTTAKPLLITRPVEPLTVLPDSGYLAHTRLLDPEGASGIAATIVEMLSDPEVRAEQERWAEHYYGDRTPGSSTARFEAAIGRVIDEVDAFRDASAAGQSAGLDYDDESVDASATVNRRMRHYVRSTRELIANQFARSRYESALRRSLVGTSGGRRTDLLVTCMAMPRNLGNLIDWLPALEEASRSLTVTILVGNMRTYRALQKLTDLPVDVAYSAAATESIVHDLAPTAILHFEQSKLNLREATYRRAAHVYIGESGDDAWINNRLRMFDVVLTPSARQSSLIRNGLLRYPATVEIRDTDPGQRVDALRRLGEATPDAG